MSERYLITGGQGFIGGWIARQLLAEGCEVALFDLRPDDHLLEQILNADDFAKLERHFGDIADTETVKRLIHESSPTAVIHLAGLQVPTCRAQPILGARVNVVGTLNVFEAVRELMEATKKPLNVVYASSAAVIGSPEDYSGPIEDDDHHRPRTHYGVFKTANEGNARVYWNDHGIPSVGLRPYTVYGVGREIGITSGPTKALKAVILGREFTIPYSGKTVFDFVEDVDSYIVACARIELNGAHACNIRGHIVDLSDYVGIVEEVLPGAAQAIHIEGGPLPLAVDLVDSNLRSLIGEPKLTALRDGVQRTVDHFLKLKSEGRLHDRDLDG